MTTADLDLNADLWRKRKVAKSDDGTWKVEGKPRMSSKLLRIETPANVPGMSFVAALVTAPPHATTPPHTHNGAAVYAQVIKGRLVSQMIHKHKVTKPDGTVEIVEDDSGVNVYGPGEMWYEAPGCHHVRSENAGDEEAQFFANFIIGTEKLDAVDNPTKALTILDVDVE